MADPHSLSGSCFGMEASTRRGRGLTAREREVLTLLARGYTGEEVARQLQVSGETVRAHVRNSVTKLHARTRLHAVVIALQRGEISLE
jgi:two-component system, NarL family, response regulator